MPVPVLSTSVNLMVRRLWGQWPCAQHWSLSLDLYIMSLYWKPSLQWEECFKKNLQLTQLLLFQFHIHWQPVNSPKESMLIECTGFKAAIWSVLLPDKSHGQRSLEGCSPWGRWGSDMTERLHFHFSLFTFMHWRRKWQPTPVFLPGESQGWGSLVGCSLWHHTESARLKWLSNSNLVSVTVVTDANW